MDLRIKLKALRILIKQLGFFPTLFLLPPFLYAKGRGKPWHLFPKAQTRKERQCREMVGDAVLLYRILQKRFPLEVVHKHLHIIIKEAAIVQLGTLIPRITKQEVIETNPEDRQQIFDDLVNSFPNVTWDNIPFDNPRQPSKKDRLQYGIRVTRCRLVELVYEVGCPELAGFFCQGDKAYFAQFQPEISFKQPMNIGQQHDPFCTFLFTL